MKRFLFLLFLFGVIFLTGCSKSETVVSNGKKVDISRMIHQHCTRAGDVDGGEVQLNYDLYSTGDVLNILKSEEKVISSDSSVLDTYDQAYRQIHSYYTGLDFYDTSVVRDDNSVTSHITINYDKIDIGRLLSIEGEEDNIVENGVAKVEKWLTLAKKFGTKCETISD